MRKNARDSEASLLLSLVLSDGLSRRLPAGTKVRAFGCAAQPRQMIIKNADSNLFTMGEIIAIRMPRKGSVSAQDYYIFCKSKRRGETFKSRIGPGRQD